MLRCSGVSLRNEEDTISWSWNHSSGFITVKSAYDALVDQNVKVDPEWWYREIWKLHIPVKIILFVWLSLQDRILIGRITGAEEE
jgi:hypothetical protein